MIERRRSNEWHNGMLLANALLENFVWALRVARVAFVLSTGVVVKNTEFRPNQAYIGSTGQLQMCVHGIQARSATHRWHLACFTYMCTGCQQRGLQNRKHVQRHQQNHTCAYAVHGRSLTSLLLVASRVVSSSVSTNLNRYGPSTDASSVINCVIESKRSVCMPRRSKPVACTYGQEQSFYFPQEQHSMVFGKTSAKGRPEPAPSQRGVTSEHTYRKRSQTVAGGGRRTMLLLSSPMDAVTCTLRSSSLFWVTVCISTFCLKPVKNNGAKWVHQHRRKHRQGASGLEECKGRMSCIDGSN